jgi:site-specific recombinase XerD
LLAILLAADVSCLPFIMLEKIIRRPEALRRHQAAPLRREREEFLAHLARGGRSRVKLRDASTYIVQFVERANFRRMRRIHLSEIRRSAENWRRRNPTFPAGAQARKHFLRYAKAWLKFHKKLIEPLKWNDPKDRRVAAFAKYLRVELGFAKRTIQSRIWELNRFLEWLEERQLLLNQITTAEVEKYIDSKSAIGWCGTTISAHTQNLKVFFRFAERRRWCRQGLSPGIFGPVLKRRSKVRKGPSWLDVRRLIDSVGKDNSNDLRARAVLLLLSMYALRASEVYNLNLADVNLQENILTIRRSKNRLIQRFSILPEVRVALQEYIQKGRPASRCPQLFLTLKRPYGPIQQASLYNITKNRMLKLGIVSVTHGPHSLRHACATHLLVSGTPVGKVASLLGHATTRYIGNYVKHSIDELRVVSDFDLKDLHAAI